MLNTAVQFGAHYMLYDRYKQTEENVQFFLNKLLLSSNLQRSEILEKRCTKLYNREYRRSIGFWAPKFQTIKRSASSDILVALLRWTSTQGNDLLEQQCHLKKDN